MADSFDQYDRDSHGSGFMMGLLTGTVLGAVTPLLADALVGMVAGALVLGGVTLVQRIRGKTA